MRDARPPLALLIGVAAIAALALAQASEIRGRAEAALVSGMPPREGALARGFVLGQDESIDSTTIEDFRRSGLSHLLAVSGQNVALLVLLAMPFLAGLGVPLRMRLVWLLGLIAVYVPLAGAGPSILRAGVMGGLSVLATLAGRRSSRLYLLLLAAVITLGIDPRLASDVGWQLSFAAVLGIILLAPSLRGAIAARLGGGGISAALGDAAAMTTAATLATAPLIAFHFEAVSTTTLLANLLALPAVGPAMWLGMLTAAAGQVPGFPVELLNRVNAPLLAFIAEVAAWCGRPSWAYPQVRIGGLGLVASYLAIATAAIVVPRLLRSRRIESLRRPTGPARRRRSRAAPLATATVAVLLLAWATRADDGVSASAPLRGLRVSVLDVGQGDAILLQPPAAPAVLVDGGPADGEVLAGLRAAGVDRLGAVLVTHDQADHAAGVGELLGALPIGRLFYGILGRRTLDAARAAGATTRRIGAGSVLRSGRLRVEVLWPPPELLSAAHDGGDDPNRLSLVAVARWRGFSMLLSADAEAEGTPLDPGPVDVLKIAHHGSEDAGLGPLLDRTTPALAVISAGEGNPFGHPAPTTLATLASRGVPVLRTDRDGSIVLDVRRGRLRFGFGG